jgi:hypothetical protein
MPANITVTAEYVDETIQRAGPGEVGGMETGAAPLGPVLDRAFSRAFYARAAVWGQLVWSGRLEVSGSAASPVVKVGPIDAVTLRATEVRSGNNVQVWRPFYSATEATLGIAQVQGAPGALSADTWYYAYAFSNGTGTLQWQISTTPPTESGTPTVLQQWKRGQEANYRFVGAFVTDGSGNPIPMVMANGRYTYVAPDVLHNDLNNVNADYSLAARVPPHAKAALVRVLATSSDGAAIMRANIGTAGATTTGGAASAWAVQIVAPSSGDFYGGTVEVPLPDASNRSVRVYASSHTNVDVSVAGFVE